MGINYDKIEETVKEIMQLEQKLENGEEQCENISIISMSAEDVLSKINSGGYIYNIEGGLYALRKFAEKEKKEMEKNNTNESGLRWAKIRERLLTDPSYNDIEITDTPLEEFLQEIENNPKIKFTTKGGIEELKKRVEREKKEKNNKKER